MLAHLALTLGRRVAASAALSLVLVAGAGADERPLPAPPTSIPPLVAQSLTPILSDWITQSRDAAVAQGVRRMPTEIRLALEGYVPDEILERVRWRAGGAGETSLQHQLFRFGYAPAVTLDYVVIFERELDALTDPKLWVHELKHVMQYADWGITEFSSRYLTDYEAVEKDASDYRWEWMKRTGRVPQVTSAR